MGSFTETYYKRVLSLYSISLQDFLKRKLADCFLKKSLIGAICGVKGSCKHSTSGNNPKIQ